MKTKEIQGKLWSVAPHYWSRQFEPFFTPIYKRVLSQVELNPEVLLLDAGCGSGLFTHMIVSSGAQAIGVDAAAGLLEVARERNPKVNFLEEDLESLPFAPETFDVVTGFNSFQYAGDFVAALTEAKRVLKQGGKFALAIWDKPEMSEATNILKAIGTLLPAPLPGTPGPFALSENGKIESVFNSIGLKLISKTKVSCPFLYQSLNESVNSFMGTGPAASALKLNDERTVRETVAKAMQPYRLTEDMIHLQNSFLVFVAEK